MDLNRRLRRSTKWRITKIEDMVTGLYSCGMSTQNVSDNIKEIYGFKASAETISNITRRVLTDVESGSYGR